MGSSHGDEPSQSRFARQPFPTLSLMRHLSPAGEVASPEAMTERVQEPTRYSPLRTCQKVRSLPYA